MERAEAWLLQTAGSPLTFVVVIVVLAVGVVVVFLPSESLVVAVAALLLARPDRDLRLAVLVVASALGLAAGDLLLYALARRLSRRTRPALAGSGLAGRFRRRLEARTTTLRARFSANPWTAMVFARLVPAGRASSDVIAADLGVPVGRFTAYSLVGGLVYGVWCVAIAALAYPLVQRHPLESTVGVIVLAVLLTSAVGRVDTVLERRRAARRGTRQPALRTRVTGRGRSGERRRGAS